MNLFHLNSSPLTVLFGDFSTIKDLINRDTQREIAKAMVWSQSQISKRLRILNLIPELLEKAKEGKNSSISSSKISFIPFSLEKFRRFIIYACLKKEETMEYVLKNKIILILKINLKIFLLRYYF